MADFNIKAHDRLPVIGAVLSTKVNGVDVIVDLTNATQVDFIMRLISGGTVPKVNSAAVMLEPRTSGAVEYHWQVGDTDEPDKYQAEWEVTWADGKTQTFPTLSYHSVDVLADLDEAA